MIAQGVPITAGLPVAEVGACSSRPPSARDKPSGPGPGGQGRSSGGALHLYPAASARFPFGRVDGRRGDQEAEAYAPHG